MNKIIFTAIALISIIFSYECSSANAPKAAERNRENSSNMAVEIAWDKVHKYDLGSFPAIAVSGNTVIEVHNWYHTPQGPGGEMPIASDHSFQYRTGVLSEDKKTVNWYQTEATQFGSGYYHNIAAFDGTVIVVNHSVEFYQGKLMYRTGQLQNNGTKIKWYDKFGPLKTYAYYDSGAWPSVFLSGDFVVEVHQDGGDDKKLYYRTGRLGKNRNIIHWYQDKGHEYDTGNSPRIVMLDDTVVEVHNDGIQFYDRSYNYYRTGKLSEDKKTIEWNKPGRIRIRGLGQDPSLTLSGNNLIMAYTRFEGGSMTHQGSNNIHYFTGQLSRDKKTVKWSIANPAQLEAGYSPNVAAVGNIVLSVNENINMELYYRTGKSSDFHKTSGYKKINLFRRQEKLARQIFDMSVKVIVIAADYKDNKWNYGTEFNTENIPDPIHKHISTKLNFYGTSPIDDQNAHVSKIVVNYKYTSNTQGVKSGEKSKILYDMKDTGMNPINTVANNTNAIYLFFKGNKLLKAELADDNRPSSPSVEEENYSRKLNELTKQ